MKKTIGHRGVDPTGETTYKKVSWLPNVSPDNRRRARERNWARKEEQTKGRSWK